MNRFCEIRFESIGGLGAHGASQILATAAVLRMGLNAAQFSSYGSEKKGSPVRSFVRLGPPDRPVRTSAPVDAPDVIVVFHAALLNTPATFSGLRDDGIVIYNAPAEPVVDVWSVLPRRARAVQIDALAIAVQEKSRPNAALLGTLCAVLPFLDREAVSEALADEFAGKHPEAVAHNARAFARGASEFTVHEAAGQRDGGVPVARVEPVWGYQTQAPGGVITEAGNTAWNNLAISRTGWMPVLAPDRCTHCGLCDLVCPDYCLVWGDGDRPPFARLLAGIDYQYCKGCMRCVESCPSGALSRTAESPGLADRLRVPRFPGLIP